MQKSFEIETLSTDSIKLSVADYPTKKLSIVGGGIVGFLEAYYAYLDAKRNDERVRVTIYEKHSTMKGTTTAHLVPSLTPYEIIAVVPRGRDLINKLSYLFSEQEGLRVDDVPGVSESSSALEFIRAVQEYGQNEEGHRARTETLLALGKMSMDLWQEIYTNADAELKEILIASNFNPCRELTNPDEKILHDGYRIDLIYRVPNAANRATATMSNYASLGYTDCKILSPEEAMKLDPSLTYFCIENSKISEDGLSRIWNNDAVAYWRPGGCLDTQIFLPLFHSYLKRVMGQYTNDEGVTKDCFRLHLQRQVEQVTYEPMTDGASINKLNGLKFFDNPNIKRNKHAYSQSDYVFCPGEAVGTLKKLGFAEPEYARFAGASLMLRINLPADKLEAYSTFSHYMSVYKNGVSSSWQARCIGNQIFIGLAGTKAFYGDQEPHKDQVFARNRNLAQLNMINDVLPEFISLALGKDTRGIQLEEADMEQLERHDIAERWAGSRAVAYDGFPTLGSMYKDDGQVSNARCTTHLGSGGASFSPAAVLVSRRSMFLSDTARDVAKKVLEYGNSQRKPAGV